MADLNNLFFIGDDFDTILGILEEEKLDEQLQEAADEVSIRFFLTHREFSEKHCALTSIFFQLDYNEYKRVNFSSLLKNCCKAKNKIPDHKIYPKSIRDELSFYMYISYTYKNSLQDVTTGFCDIEELYKCLIKSGNAERFYSSFYPTIALTAVKHF